MKLYYHTSSLNINSMLVTDTISPATFYKKRSFGSTRFEPLKEYDCSYIPLCTNIHNFSLIHLDKELDRRKAVIELDIEENDLIKITDYFYITKSTIYLTKNNAKFIFENIDDYDFVRAKASLVVNTKYGKDLLDASNVRYATMTNLNSHPSISVDEGILPTERELRLIIRRDNFINSIKGALFMYIYHNRVLSDTELKATVDRFYALLSTIVDNKHDFKAKDNVFRLILTWLCIEPNAFKADISNLDRLQLLESIEGLLTCTSSFKNVKDDIKALKGVYTTESRLLDQEFLQSCKNPYIKALYLVLNRYRNYEECMAIGNKYLANFDFVVAIFYGAYTGYAAISTTLYKELTEDWQKYMNNLFFDIYSKSDKSSLFEESSRPARNKKSSSVDEKEQITAS